jgi:threonine aldolase
LHYEAGGTAAIVGATTYPLEGKNGIFTLEQFESAIRPKGRHFPQSRAVLIEQTSNLGRGSIWPLETIEKICTRAGELGIVRHMDGARLFNAVVATGNSARAYASHFDSVWFDFSKGLGAPAGAILAGSKEFVNEAWKCKQRLGGGMRQSGMLGAAALYALDHHIERLAEDHANAQLLARGLTEIEGIYVEPVETNMVFFDVSALGQTADGFCEMMQRKGIRFSVIWPSWVRAVPHLGISRDQIEETLQVIREVVSALRRRSAEDT